MEKVSGIGGIPRQIWRKAGRFLYSPMIKKRLRKTAGRETIKFTAIAFFLPYTSPN
jgi:hypothetical protein